LPLSIYFKFLVPSPLLWYWCTQHFATTWHLWKFKARLKKSENPRKMSHGRNVVTFSLCIKQLK